MASVKQLVVIGVNAYSSKPWRTLNNTVVDIERISRVLTGKYGFVEEERLLDAAATREGIVDRLNNICKGLIKGDSLVVYFAGHGVQDPDSQKGFWIPAEGSADKSTWINNETILEILQGCPASHILLISDSCFSGTFNTEQFTIAHYEYDLLEMLPSRWILTAGRIEKVEDGDPGDGSPFNRILCEYLESLSQEAVCAEELFHQIKSQMFGNFRQQPTFGPFDPARHRSGQLIFRAQRPRGRTSRPPDPYPKFPVPDMPGFKSYIPRSVSPYTRRENTLFGFEMEKEGLPLIDLVGKERKLALLGGAGSGKSIELVELAKKLQETPGQQIAIYARFNTYAGEDIAAFLPAGWKEPPEDKRVLLLDGLDEIPSSERNIALRKLTKFMDEFAKVRMICTCRTNLYDVPGEGFSGTLVGFAAYKINPVPLKAIKAYARDQFGVDGDAFIAQVLEHKLIDLVSLPFFLNILLNTFLLEGKLYADRSRIMREALFTQFAKDIDRYQTVLDPPLERPEMTAYLSRIAFVMERLGRNFLTPDELYNLFPDGVLLRRLKFLPAFTHHPETNRWQFDHNNLQEYLAAEVLSRLPLQKILDILTLRDLKRVRPTWANTLSFFVSVAPTDKRNAIIDWVKEYDPEFIVRFETDKMAPDLRVDMAKKILDGYNTKSIPLASNKFDYPDLARFANEEPFIGYLLNVLRTPRLSPVARNNTLKVLSYMDLRHLPALQPDVRACLLTLLDGAAADHYLVYLLLRALGNLQILDHKQLEQVIATRRRHKNEYIRAGLYKLIMDLDQTDAFITVLVDGLDLQTLPDPIEDRGPGHLMDEDFLLTQALKTIKTAPAIKALFNRLADPKAMRHIYSPGSLDVFEYLVEKSSALYGTDSGLFSAILNLWVVVGLYFDQPVSKCLGRFFENTKTQSEAFWAVWSDNRLPVFDRISLTAGLIDEAIIDQVVERFVAGNIEREDLERFHSALTSENLTNKNGQSMARLLDERISARATVVFHYPEVSDRRQVLERRAQESFNLLFDLDLFEAEVAAIFGEIQKDEITLHDLFETRKINYQTVDQHFASTAIEFLRLILLDFPGLSLPGAVVWIRGNAFRRFRLLEVYDYHTGSKGHTLSVSAAQQSAIIRWIDEWIRNADMEIVVRYDWAIMRAFWYFIQAYNIAVPHEKLLSFTLYFDFHTSNSIEEKNTLDELERRLSASSIHARVLINLSTLPPDTQAWAENAAYALRNGLSGAIPLVTHYLETTTQGSNKVVEMLQLLANHHPSRDPIKAIATHARSSWVRQEAIRLFEHSGSEKGFISTWSMNLLANPAETAEMKLFATSRLLLLADLRGLDYLLTMVAGGASERNLAQIGPMNTFDSLDALPAFLRLLYWAKSQAPSENAFGFFDAKVTEAILRIGLVSHDQFMAVKAALEKFQVDNDAELGGLGYLSLVIQKMENQLLLNRSADITLTAAIEEYRELLPLLS